MLINGHQLPANVPTQRRLRHCDPDWDNDTFLALISLAGIDDRSLNVVEL
ncbi:hypothetical protein [Roseobacter sp. SK209-2-6]|nr:hypothetical protein [Roseobacter sp. SK209-2-6]